MVFRNRQEAANKLFLKLQKEPLLKTKNKPVVVSLLRGGVALGTVLAKKIDCPHLPLIVTKIPAPYNVELAIGALCFDITYLENKIIAYLQLDKGKLRQQIKLAEHKFIQYCNRFDLNKTLYKQIVDKNVILTDDGIATGASIKAALLFLRSEKAAKIILAVPVAAADTKLEGFDKTYILAQSKYFGAVSQYYKNFPQIEDAEVKKLLNN